MFGGLERQLALDALISQSRIIARAILFLRYGLKLPISQVYRTFDVRAQNVHELSI